MMKGIVWVSLVSAWTVVAAGATDQGTKSISIGLIGDSTVAVQSGWGPAFAERFKAPTNVLNYAKNGATLKSLSKQLDALVALKPDYVLIQFGHNDQKQYDTKVYSELLKSYLARIKDAGSKPIILSSVVRRTFDENGKIVSGSIQIKGRSLTNTLTAYAQAAQAVATDKKVPFIDLHAISAEHHNQIGVEASMSYNFTEGDKTHFNKKGAEAIVGLILPELMKIAPELKAYLREDKGPSAGPFSRQCEYVENPLGIDALKSGLPARNALGVRLLRMGQGAALYEVGSGAYRFERCL
jgi:lysophospholipase L1-like esterase